MPLRLALPSLLLVLCGFATGCSASIGDTCSTNVECSASMPGTICDISIPEGYCTLANCQPNGCPDDAVCVRFDEESAYCMLNCEDDSDCRDGHTCRKDKGDYGFCYLPAK